MPATWSAPTGATGMCRTLVLATGACNIACVPRLAEAVPATIATLTPMEYRNPDQLEDGGVLVVGASATGIQLADEIHRSGRPVTLAVGEHIRAPRTYRGRDIQWWMDAAGVLDERYDEVDDIVRARRVPSLQLVGSPGADDARPQCADRDRRRAGRPARRHQRRQGAVLRARSRNQCALADLKMGRLLDTFDGWATDHGLDAGIEPPHRFAADRGRRRAAAQPRSHAAATSGRSSGRPATAPTTPGSRCPCSTARARSATTAGSSPRPGMYVMGLPFLRRRKSALIDGAADDARDLSDHLASYLAG